MDAQLEQRTHLKSEPVCGFLLELVKPDGEATLRGVLPTEVVEAITTLAPAIISRHGPIRRACEKAAKSGSRLKQFALQRLAWGAVSTGEEGGDG